jgi:hypothetical protein
MASRNRALPRDSHVQSHAAVHKNELCDSHAALVARAIAGGWTRPQATCEDRQLSGSQIRSRSDDLLLQRTLLGIYANRIANIGLDEPAAK